MLNRCSVAISCVFKDQEEAKTLVEMCTMCEEYIVFSPPPPTFLQGTQFTGSYGPAGPPVSVSTVHIIPTFDDSRWLGVSVHPLILSQGMTGPPGITGPQGPRGDPGEIVRNSSPSRQVTAVSHAVFAPPPANPCAPPPLRDPQGDRVSAESTEYQVLLETSCSCR